MSREQGMRHLFVGIIFLEVDQMLVLDWIGLMSGELVVNRARLFGSGLTLTYD